MSFKSAAVELTTDDQDIYVCASGAEGSDHGLVFGNLTGSAQTVTVKLWKQALGSAVTLAVLSVPANEAVPWPKPINMSAALHDHMREDLQFNLIDCDALLLVAMRADGVPSWLRWATFFAVRTNKSRYRHNT